MDALVRRAESVASRYFSRRARFPGEMTPKETVCPNCGWTVLDSASGGHICMLDKPKGEKVRAKPAVEASAPKPVVEKKPVEPGIPF